MFEAALDTRVVDLVPVSAMVTDYARLQQSTINADRSAGAGIACWETAYAPADAERQARPLHDLAATDPRHITRSQRDQIPGALDAIQTSSTALATSPVPFCIEHAHLRPGNVLPPRGPQPRYRFIDFGDIAWTHPFLSLIMLVIECRYRWSGPDLPGRLNIDDPNLGHILDAYLNCWTQHAPHDQLRRTLCHALRLAPLRCSQAWIDNLMGVQPPSGIG